MFVYTREAHPGENVLHHDSFERKLASAKLLAEEAGIGRDILVDDLVGTVHRAYGLMPNMTWVIGRGGRVAYKANWTSAVNVEAFLARFLDGRVGHPPGTSPAMYETQQIEFRDTDRQRFMQHLLRNGPRAVAEFDKARHLWSGRAASDG
ncbi:MAG: hypothetical protein LBV34_10695 [Nocardiopsaceae bacterium]|nr:hypothetical protein [Nocardiopsaceae bacterium]